MSPRYSLIAVVMLVLSLVAACGQAAPRATPAPSGAPPEPTIATLIPATVTRVPPTATMIPPTATAIPSPTDIPSSATPAPTMTPLAKVAPANPSLGDAWIRPADGMVMVYVPGGTFQMGSDKDDADAKPDELPSHAVTLDGFWMDQTEVTNAQFVAFLNAHGNAGEGGRKMVEMERGYCQIRQEEGAYRVGSAAFHPVLMVTWYGADTYCQWVGGRLPSEAEWEYAARGPESHLYPWGDDAPTCERARYGDCARSAMPVASLPDGASWCGVLDMSGNVWEWVADWYGDYPSGHQENPNGPASGSFRVVRGGGWHSPRWEIRATSRLGDTPPTGYNG
jgi:formylglycine-generating enzyme required for sulfatase activity